MNAEQRHYLLTVVNCEQFQTVT